MSSSVKSDENSNVNVELKRRQNIEDNRRFLAALKINDIRDEIKHATNHQCDPIDKASSVVSVRRPAKREVHNDDVRRSSRIRKNVVQTENMPPCVEKPRRKKKTDENQPQAYPKVKLQLPDHMLIRYQSTGKRVALHNSKATLGNEDEELAKM